MINWCRFAYIGDHHSSSFSPSFSSLPVGPSHLSPGYYNGGVAIHVSVTGLTFWYVIVSWDYKCRKRKKTKLHNVKVWLKILMGILLFYYSGGKMHAIYICYFPGCWSV